MFNAEKRQIFYFDDFLGKTRLSAGSLNHDQRIIDFINLISGQKNSILILTTREYVLNQAIEILGDFEFNASLLVDAKYILEMSVYTTYEKALILYNHLFYSKITNSNIGKILNSEKYRAIVEHRNYIPRIIDWVINHNSETSDENFAELLWQHLENPEKLWRTVVEKHISQSARNLIAILFIYESIEYNAAKQIYKEYNESLFDLGYSQNSASDFDDVLKELNGSLINIIISESSSAIEFNNSSIIDYLNIYFSSNIEYLVRIIRYSGNIRLLWHLASIAFEPNRSRIFEGKVNPFLNPSLQLVLAEFIGAYSFNDQGLSANISEKNADMAYVLEKSIIISSNRSLYTKLIIDLADKFISDSFNKKHSYIYEYVENIKNTIIVSKMSQKHNFLIPYAINNLNKLMSSAYSISDALRIIKIHSLLQYPDSIDKELNQKIRTIVIKHSENSLEDLDEPDIDSMIKLCNEVLEYDTLDKDITEVLNELNYLQSLFNQRDESEQEEIDQEKDEISYTESLSDDYINYEDFLGRGDDYFQDFSDLFYDFDLA